MSISSKAANCCENRHEQILTSVSVSSRCRLHFAAGNMRPQSYGRRVTTGWVTFPASVHMVAPTRASTSTPARPRYDYCKVQYKETTNYRNKQTNKHANKQRNNQRQHAGSSLARAPRPLARSSKGAIPQGAGSLFLSPLSPASLSLCRSLLLSFTKSYTMVMIMSCPFVFLLNADSSNYKYLIKLDTIYLKLFGESILLMSLSMKFVYSERFL